MTKSVSDSTPNVGDTVTFTVTANNAGPDAATAVAVIDLLPAGLTFVTATPSHGTYDAATGAWSVGTIADGESAMLTLSTTVVSPAGQTNTASVTGADQFDPNLADNSASVVVTPQQADLSLIKTVDDSTPNVGDTLTFTVTASNAGPDAATAVTITDVLPAGLTFVSATPSQGTYDSATGLWTVGTITNGASPTLTVTVTVVSPDARTNTASVSGASQFDPDPGDNSASATVTPQQADLSLFKTVSDSTPSLGATVIFTVIANNAGPDAATAVTVLDLLPPGLTFVTASTSQGTYDSATGLWSVGTIANGGSATLTLSVTVDSLPQINTATVAGADQFDPDPADNVASVSLA